MSAFRAILSLLFLSNLVQGFQYTNEALLDQVVELPGLQWKPSFNHFSGYLNLAGTKKFIHYWLVESENVAPETAPSCFGPMAVQDARA
jgi:hypothetical protein